MLAEPRSNQESSDITPMIPSSYGLIGNITESALTAKYWTYKKNMNEKIISIFVGLTDKVNEGKWVWESDGSELQYTFGASGQPGRPSEADCGMMTYSLGKWHDIGCGVGGYFAICQKP